MISDLDLIRAAHPATVSTRRYAAVYLDGTKIHLAAETASAARAIAREYGVRFLGGVRLHSVERTE